MASYIGIIEAVDGVLICGQKKVVSSRFELEEDAEQWCKNSIKIGFFNLSADQKLKWKVKESEGKPEIPAKMTEPFKPYK